MSRSKLGTELAHRNYGSHASYGPQRRVNSIKRKPKVVFEGRRVSPLFRRNALVAAARAANVHYMVQPVGRGGWMCYFSYDATHWFSTREAAEEAEEAARVAAESQVPFVPVPEWSPLPCLTCGAVGQLDRDHLCAQCFRVQVLRSAA
jgi:hypothetical protein